MGVEVILDFSLAGAISSAEPLIFGPLACDWNQGMAARIVVGSQHEIR